LQILQGFFVFDYFARIRENYLKSTAGKNWLKKYFEENGGITGSLPA